MQGQITNRLFKQFELKYCRTEVYAPPTPSPPLVSIPWVHPLPCDTPL